VDRDRLAGAEALAEIVALEHARDGVARGEADHSLGAELVRPLGVVQHLRLLRIEDLEHLRAVGLRVLLDLLARQRRASLVLARRVADHAGEIADQELHLVAEVLEMLQLVDHHGVAQVQIGSSRIEPELDAQRTSAGEFLRELFLDDQLVAAALDEFECFLH